MSISRHLANLVDGHAAGPDGYVRLAIDASVWTALAAGCAAGLHDLCALWADGGAMRMALSDSGRGLRAIVSLQTSAGRYPSVAAHHPPALRLERAMRDLHGVQPIGLPDPRPWLDHGRWEVEHPTWGEPGEPTRDSIHGPFPRARCLVEC